METSNINWVAMGDAAILKALGSFIREQRLAKNMTQEHLAKNAGINRSTLSLLEKGGGCNLMTFIQVLRILYLLNLLNTFQTKKVESPLKLAKQQHTRSLRASPTTKKPSKPKSDW